MAVNLSCDIETIENLIEKAERLDSFGMIINALVGHKDDSLELKCLGRIISEYAEEIKIELKDFIPMFNDFVVNFNDSFDCNFEKVYHAIQLISIGLLQEFILIKQPHAQIQTDSLPRIDKYISIIDTTWREVTNGIYSLKEKFTDLRKEIIEKQKNAITEIEKVNKEIETAESCS